MLTMKIGELAKRTGLTPSRIRFYERIGLLRVVQRQPNGYRTYPPEAVLALELITSAQTAGFSLDELRALLPSDFSNWDPRSLVEVLRQKVRDIELMQERLACSKAQLVNVLSQVEQAPCDILCAADAQRVLARCGLPDIDRVDVRDEVSNDVIGVSGNYRH